MYEFDSRVRYSEVDHHGTMTVPALINYFQDCSTFQSEDLGIGTAVLKEEKRAWLLSYWQVILNRKPELGEKITIGTFATEFKGLFGNRNFYMKDADGNISPVRIQSGHLLIQRQEDQPGRSQRMFSCME